MPLVTGSRLGPYDILSPLGAGGMGEVYRAKDTKLGRDVALKILPVSFTNDPERVARFRREAQVLASLNHPHIAQIHGMDEASGTQFLVLELVDGESLDKRIARGPIPVDETLIIAKQIAEALEAAHEKGIIHRDLKPANIALTKDGQVKVLDFGLAKAVESTSGSFDAMNSPTITSPALMTGVGGILGTAAYMSPEQVKGKQIDKRTDIWAFGVVLYEMLAGERLFKGEDVAEILAAVIHEQPDLGRVPPTVRLLLGECLQKDPKLRLRDIGDAWRVIKEPSAHVQRRPFLGWSVAGLFALIAAFMVPSELRYLRQKPPVTGSPVRFQISRPEQAPVGLSEFALSPDGRHLVYATSGADGVRRLWMRNMDSLDTKPLPGSETEGVVIPFWSPDSRYVVFKAGGKMKKMDVGESSEQRSVQTIANVPVMVGSWSRDGVILFQTSSAESRGIQRVNAAGGPITTVTRPAAGEIHVSPTFLPDGKHFLYLRGSRGETGIYIGSRDAKPEEQDAKRLLLTPSGAEYVPDGNGDSGFVLFVREGTLFAQGFDPHLLRLNGDPLPVAQGVANVGLWGAFSASDNGVLAYVSGGQGTDTTWFDRHGTTTGVERIGPLPRAALSPDGTRIAYLDGTPLRIWLLERTRNARRPVTRGPAVSSGAVWSWDGNRIAYAVAASGSGIEPGIYEKALNDDRGAELLVTSTTATPTDYSADGHYLIYTQSDTETKDDVWALPLNGDRKPFPVLRGEFNERRATLSADSRWIAYVSDESGKEEVSVRPFRPGPDGGFPTGSVFPVSTDGGWQARWRRDGHELFYQTADGRIMSVDVTTNPAFRTGTPRVLFQAQPLAGPTFDGVTTDGAQFLVRLQGTARANPFTVVLNWSEELKQRVPTK
jgi:serine/threonine protein kinase